MTVQLPAQSTAKSTEQRIFNFSAGPAVLPVPVLEQVRDEELSGMEDHVEEVVASTEEVTATETPTEETKEA